MINVTHSKSRIYMIFLLFLGLILCLQFPSDGFLGKDKTLDKGHKSKQITRSIVAYATESSKYTIEIVHNAVLIGNIWRGQLRKIHATTRHIEKIYFEIDIKCKDLVSLHFYTSNTERIFHEGEIIRRDSSTYNVTIVQIPQPIVEVKNTTNNQILLCIPVLDIQSPFHLINLQRIPKTINDKLSPEEGKHSVWRMETIHRDERQPTRPTTDCHGKDKANKLKLYKYTDGRVIRNISNAKNNIIHGGYVLPLNDCHSIQRNKFGLTITLDNDGNAEGEVKIKRNNFTNTEEAEQYIHMKIKVIEGNCLKMNVLHSDDLGEAIFLNTIHFYGLYGHPDSFVIDKGKRYILEEDLSNSRRITNKIRSAMLQRIKSTFGPRGI